MSETLLLITIGPVQEFIASARTLRDLWFGSWCLSELSKSVAKSILDQGGELIFPAVTSDEAALLDPGSSLNVANKIMAVAACGDTADSFSVEAKKSWQQKLQGFARQVKEHTVPVGINWEQFDRQLLDYGEFYAVRVDIQSSGGYAMARERAEQLLNARKALRAFERPDWKGAGIKKNSIDGARETVFDKPREIRGLVKSGEELDAMGCIKRFAPLGKYRNRFYDLSDMAIVPWLTGIIKRKEKLDAYHHFAELIRPFVSEPDNNRLPDPLMEELGVNLPGYLLFLDPEALRKELGDPGSFEKIARARAKISPEAHTYAAILVGDGDHMGKVIKGIETREGHTVFTRGLSSFAERCGKIIQEHCGGLIYAGGDDVMAYLPLHRVIDCADALRKAFYMIMKTVHQDLGIASGIPVPTFSIGIALVHHKAPLDRALDLARLAERQAKDAAGRNALAIIRKKRSGADISIHGKFDARGELPGICDRLNRIVSYFRHPDAILPNRLGYQLRQATRLGTDKLVFTVTNEGVTPETPMSAEVKRLFDQKNGKDPILNAELQQLLAGRRSLRQLSDELVIGQQLFQAVRTAEGKEDV